MDIWESYDGSKAATRWFCYFDLLGTKALLKKNTWAVFDAYSSAIERANKLAPPKVVNLNVQWFSDTFIAYAEHDSASHFTEIESFARWFVNFMVEARVPLRGSISCGEIYADRELNILFGDALVEAHEYGEAQDWIGLVLCPSAEKHMSKIGLPIEKRLHYAKYRIPYKSVPNNLEAKLGACLFGIEVNGKNTSIETLQNMRERITEDSIKRKYTNTIDFLKANHRSVPPKKVEQVKGTIARWIGCVSDSGLPK